MFKELREGRSRWFRMALAPDVHFRFPGDHSWAADYRTRAEVEDWLERYVRTGLRLYPQESVVTGPPWRTTVCTWFLDSARGPDGELVYENEGVLVDTLRWGRVKEHISFEDTQKTAAFDDYLRRQGRL
jgi:hypothetical protein